MRATGRSLRTRGCAFLCAAVLLGLLAPAAPAVAATLSVSLTGAGAGTVGSDPAGIDCTIEAGVVTPPCSNAAVPNGSSVTLSATPKDAGSVFAGWTVTAGTCTGRANPCQVSFGALGGTASLTAQFIPTPARPGSLTAGDAPGQAGYLRKLEGAVNPNSSQPTECSFEYGPTTAYGTSVLCVPGPGGLGSGSSPVAVSAETEPLEPNSAYHYRLVAANLGGVATGEDRTFVSGTAPADPCSDAQARERRAEQGIPALLLPACMALELVSPPAKANQPAKFPFVSADGNRVAFYSTAPLGGTPGALSPTGDAYVATRSDRAGGWQTEATVPPAGFPRGWAKSPEARSFSPDLSRWFQVASTALQFQAGMGQAFSGGLGGAFDPLSPLLIPPEGATPRSEKETSVIGSMRFQAASADHTHLLLEPAPSVTYLSGDPVPAGVSADDNLYVASLAPGGEPSLALLARDAVGPDAGKVWGGRCGVRIGGNRTGSGEITRSQGAVSADGRRIYFSTRPAQPQTSFCKEANRLRIMVRSEEEVGGELKAQIEELFSSECTRVAPPCSTADGDDRYQAASEDGSKVYFITTRQLANSDTDATADLYLYDADRPAGERLTQVSAGGSGDATPGSGANVQGNVTAISTDGSHAYFIAPGVLTTAPNPASATAISGQSNLYLWDVETEATSFVGTLDAADSEGLWGSTGGFENQAYPVPASGEEGGREVGGDGHVLLFESKASLTASDADGGHLDVFRYDSASDSLTCVSCRPGGPDAEPFDVSVSGDVGGASGAGTDFAEKGRWASEDGQTVAFTTSEPLLPGDGNGAPDFYLWRAGQLYRLPGEAFVAPPKHGRRGGPVLSHSGDEVAFQTGSQLLPQDGDDAPDVYVARVSGGFPFPPAVESCSGEACQAPFRSQPPGSGNGTEGSREGNRTYPVRCKKHFVRRHGKCVSRRQPHRHRPHRRKQRSNANSHRRAAK